MVVGVARGHPMGAEEKEGARRQRQQETDPSHLSAENTYAFLHVSLPTLPERTGQRMTKGKNIYAV